MKTSLAFLACALAALFCLPAGTRAKPVDFPGGLAYTLVVDGTGGDSVRVDATPPAEIADPAALVVTPVDVEGPNGRPAGLLERFKTAWQAIPGANAFSLTITVEKPAELPPGRYLLLLSFSGAAPAPDSATLTLNLDASDIAPPVPVVIGQEAWWWGGSSAPGKLILHEQGRKAGLSSFTIFDEPAAPADPWEERGTLNFSPATAGIAPGGTVVVDVTPAGDFSVGKSTGRLRVESPNLAGPVLVDYEVHTRRPLWLIFLSAILGLLLGYGSRVFLRNKLAAIHALADASQAIAELDKAWHAIRDPRFRQQVSDAKQAFQQTATRDASADVISGATRVAMAALSDAKLSLDNREKDLRGLFDPLRATLLPPYRLPGHAAGLLLAARNRVEDIAAMLDPYRNVAGASARLEMARGAEVAALVRAAGEWRHFTGIYMTEVRDHPPALPKDGAGNLASEVNAWVASFGSFDDPLDYSADSVGAQLHAAHAAYSRVEDIADLLRRNGTEMARWARAQFDLPANAAAFDPLDRSAAEQATLFLADVAADHPDSSLPAARRSAQGQLWLGVLTQLLPQGADPGAIRTSLAAGQWVEAVLAAVKLRAAPQQGELPGRPRQAFAAVVAPPPVAGGMHFRSEYLAAVTLPTPALTGSTTERKVFAGESARLMFAQTCIVGVIFIALAYRLFEPGWTGTFQEMLGVFAWGFFIDLSADGVLPLLRKMIPAAATA